MLTKEDIQFIDNYLLKSEVIYKDIRVEMIDHVATAVEEIIEVNNVSFYDAIKSYMINHKADLLKQNEFHYKIYKSLFKSILIKSLSLVSVVVFVLALTLNYVIIFELKLLKTANDFKFYSLGVLLIPLIITLLFNRFNLFKSISSGRRYSATNGMCVLLLISYYVIDIISSVFFKFLEAQILCFGCGFLIVFTFNFCLTLHDYINKYKKQFVN